MDHILFICLSKRGCNKCGYSKSGCKKLVCKSDYYSKSH